MENYGGNCPRCGSPADFTDYVGLTTRETVSINCSNPTCEHGVSADTEPPTSVDIERVKKRVARAGIDPIEKWVGAVGAFEDFSVSIDHFIKNIAAGMRVPEKYLRGPADAYIERANKDPVFIATDVTVTDHLNTNRSRGTMRVTLELSLDSEMSLDECREVIRRVRNMISTSDGQVHLMPADSEPDQG